MFAKVRAEAGAEVLLLDEGVVTSWQVSPSIPGGQIHEQGICLMGDDPRKFVTDRWGKCHDVPTC